MLITRAQIDEFRFPRPFEMEILGGGGEGERERERSLKATFHPAVAIWISRMKKKRPFDTEVEFVLERNSSRKRDELLDVCSFVNLHGRSRTSRLLFPAGM